MSDPYVLVVGDHVRDMRPEFGGRTGLLTLAQNSKSGRVLLFVRPDGYRAAEWNATPDLVALVHPGRVCADVPDDAAGIHDPAGGGTSAR